jgi:benzoate-CoA ligase
MTEPFNAAVYLTERRVAAGDTDRVALRHPRGTHTYGQLTDEVRRIAGGLAAIGVRPEERVLLCLADDVELATGILAAMYLGAVAVPCSTMLTGGELAKLVVDSRARVLLGGHQFTDAVTAAAAGAPDLRHAVLTGDTAPVVAGVTGLTWDALRAAEPLAAAYPTWDESPALWLYTSVSRPRSSSSPTAWATACSSRSRWARARCWSPPGPTRRSSPTGSSSTPSRCSSRVRASGAH